MADSAISNIFNPKLLVAAAIATPLLYSFYKKQGQIPETELRHTKKKSSVSPTSTQAPLSPVTQTAHTIFSSSKYHNRPQITSVVLMVKPRDFQFNEQTALDNEFQTRPEMSEKELRQIALEEFDKSVALLRSKGVQVVVFDKDEAPELAKDVTPDAQFPNNWFSTGALGNIHVWKLQNENRRLECNALPFIIKKLQKEGFRINYVIDHRYEEITGGNQAFLEGTGSMIFDRDNMKVYASLSKRTYKSPLALYGESYGYEVVMFRSQTSNGAPFYHTNIILCIGTTFIVVCPDSIVPEDRERVMKHIRESGKDVIEITLEQTEKHFCGNMLQVCATNDHNKTFIVMSETARNGLTQEQRDQLSKHAEIVALPIQKIEEVGGGSARCMLAEVFLPRREENYERF